VYFEPRFMKEGESLKPEARLPMSMLGAFCFPVSLEESLIVKLIMLLDLPLLVCMDCESYTLDITRYRFCFLRFRNDLDVSYFSASACI